MIEPTNDSPELTPLMREALAWVVRLRSGEATNADLEDVRAWRTQSPQHEAAFVQAARLWRNLKGAADNLAVIRDAGLSTGRSSRRVYLGPGRRAFLGGAIAASAAVYMLYDPPLDLWPSLGELQADYRTGKGERRDVAIADGVNVTLNTHTSIAILSRQQDDPQIRLIAGEAAIKTERSVDRPLTVQALDMRVIATQAAYNVKCIDAVAVVTCFDGVLDVEHARDLVRLRAGQQVAFSAGEGLAAPAAVDPELAVAWQRGLLIIRDRPLADVVEEVNRYRPGRIVITNARLGRRVVNGTFQIERLDNFPTQVQQLFGAGVRSLPGGVVFLS